MNSSNSKTAPLGATGNFNFNDEASGHSSVGAPPRSGRFSSILKEFYKDAVSGDGNSNSESDTNDTNINSPNFNPRGYFEEILKTQTLSDLIKSHNTMASEIKKLDSDMKTLVYDNYNKFVSATETIRKMKSNVENMEEEMKRLSSNMDTIGNCSEHINTTLSQRRTKIEQLSSVHRLLKKLQFLFELPSRLSKSVELEAYSQAVKYYNKTSGILKRYDNFPSFQSIQVECKQIIQQLKIKLQTRLKDPKTTTSDVIESVTLLLDLNESPTGLREEYLIWYSILMGDPNYRNSRRTYLENKLTAFSSTSEGGIETTLGNLNKTFLPEYTDCIKCFITLFIQQSNNTQKRESSQQLDLFSKNLLSKYLGIARKILLESIEPGELLLGLRILYDDLQSVSARLPTELAISEKAAELITNTVQNQIDILFSKVQNTVREYIQKASISSLVLSNISNNDVATSESSQMAEPQNSPLLATNLAAPAVTPPSSSTPTTEMELPSQVTSTPLSLSKLCTKLYTAIISDTKTLLDKFKAYFSTADFLSKHCNTFMTNIHTKMQRFFLLFDIGVREHLDDESKGQDSKDSSPRFILVLTRICMYLEAEGVQQVGNSLTNLRQLLETKSSDYSAHFNIFELQTRLKTTAENLLHYYVKLCGQKLSQMVRKGIDTPNWLKMKESRGPRSAVELIWEEIEATNKEVVEIFSSANEKAPIPEISRTNMNFSGRTSVSGATGSLVKKNGGETNKALFEKKTPLFNEVEFNRNRNSILVEIIKISVKAFLEYVRLKTFGRNGYQQMQVDIFFLQTAMQPYAKSSESIITSLGDVLVNVGERCLDPLQLEHGCGCKHVRSQIGKIPAKERKYKH